MNARLLVHEAVYAQGPRALVDFAVPFLREGLDGGERAAVALAPELAERVRAGVDDPRLQVVAATAPPGVPDALTAMRDAAGSDRSRRLRLVGQVPYGPDPARWSEWMRFEALVNTELASSPLWLVCWQDEDEPDRERLDNARRTHTHVRAREGDLVPNHAYVDTRTVLEGLSAGRPHPLQACPPVLTLPPALGLDAVPAVRAAVRAALEPRDADFLTAVTEVVTNAVQHGRPPAHVELWRSAEHLVCTVRDLGPGLGDPGEGYSARHLAHDDSPRLGLRVVRRLVDGMDHYRDDDGFTVRLTTVRR